MLNKTEIPTFKLLFEKIESLVARGATESELLDLIISNRECLNGSNRVKAFTLAKLSIYELALSSQDRALTILKSRFSQDLSPKEIITIYARYFSNPVFQKEYNEVHKARILADGVFPNFQYILQQAADTPDQALIIDIMHKNETLFKVLVWEQFEAGFSSYLDGLMRSNHPLTLEWTKVHEISKADHNTILPYMQINGIRSKLFGLWKFNPELFYSQDLLAVNEEGDCLFEMLLKCPQGREILAENWDLTETLLKSYSTTAKTSAFFYLVQSDLTIKRLQQNPALIYNVDLETLLPIIADILGHLSSSAEGIKLLELIILGNPELVKSFDLNCAISITGHSKTVLWLLSSNPNGRKLLKTIFEIAPQLAEKANFAHKPTSYSQIAFQHLISDEIGNEIVKANPKILSVKLFPHFGNHADKGLIEASSHWAVLNNKSLHNILFTNPNVLTQIIAALILRSAGRPLLDKALETYPNLLQFCDLNFVATKASEKTILNQLCTYPEFHKFLLKDPGLLLQGNLDAVENYQATAQLVTPVAADFTIACYLAKAERFDILTLAIDTAENFYLTQEPTTAEPSSLPKPVISPHNSLIELIVTHKEFDLLKKLLAHNLFLKDVKEVRQEFFASYTPENKKQVQQMMALIRAENIYKEMDLTEMPTSELVEKRDKALKLITALPVEFIYYKEAQQLKGQILLLMNTKPPAPIASNMEMAFPWASSALPADYNTVFACEAFIEAQEHSQFKITFLTHCAKIRAQEYELRKALEEKLTQLENEKAALARTVEELNKEKLQPQRRNEEEEEEEEEEQQQQPSVLENITLKVAITNVNNSESKKRKVEETISQPNKKEIDSGRPRKRYCTLFPDIPPQSAKTPPTETSLNPGSP